MKLLYMHNILRACVRTIAITHIKVLNCIREAFHDSQVSIILIYLLLGLSAAFLLPSFFLWANFLLIIRSEKLKFWKVGQNCARTIVLLSITLTTDITLSQE